MLAARLMGDAPHLLRMFQSVLSLDGAVDVAAQKFGTTTCIGAATSVGQSTQTEVTYEYTKRRMVHPAAFYLIWFLWLCIMRDVRTAECSIVNLIRNRLNLLANRCNLLRIKHFH